MLFTTPNLGSEEKRVIERINEVRENLRYALSAPSRWYGLLRRSTFARCILGSNSIEGYNISAEDAIAAIEGEEPAETEKETWMAIMGYRSAMTYVLQLANDPHFSYTEGLIRSLHFMMLQYDLTKNPGRWRPGPIYVRNDAKKEIVYEAPAAEEVPALMKELIDSLNEENDKGIPPMVRAAMSHLNLAMIHPFSDGNGRMARCVQTLVLAREGIMEPQFCSIEEYLGRATQDYYDVLAEVGQGSWHPQNDARAWIQFCLTAHFRQASRLLARSKETKRVWDQLEIEIQRRGLPDRVIYALHDAAFGFKVRNATYRAAADITLFVASRDLQDLVSAGLLVASGEKRGRTYERSQFMMGLRERAREPYHDVDPFKNEAPRLPGF